MPSIYGFVIIAIGVSLLLVALHGAKGLEITKPPQAPGSVNLDWASQKQAGNVG